MTTPNLRDNEELWTEVREIILGRCGRQWAIEMEVGRILDAVQAALTPEAAPEQPRPEIWGKPQPPGVPGPDGWIPDPTPASVPTPATCDFCKVEWATCPHGLRGSRV
jgi:hypothetical protein